MGRGQDSASETLPQALVLAVAGGFLDAYTYLTRGGVFANAVTGNMVLLGVRLLQGDLVRAAAYLAPILAFALGVWGSEVLHAARRGQKGSRWRLMALGLEIGVVVLVALLPESLNMLANSLVSFTCAIQVETFRRVEGNPFASTMCTGNLRSGTELLFRRWKMGDREAGRNALCYYAVIVAFIGGAALGVPLCTLLGTRAALACAVILALCVALLCWDMEKWGERTWS